MHKHIYWLPHQCTNTSIDCLINAQTHLLTAPSMHKHVHRLPHQHTDIVTVCPISIQTKSKSKISISERWEVLSVRKRFVFVFMWGLGPRGALSVRGNVHSFNTQTLVEHLKWDPHSPGEALANCHLGQITRQTRVGVIKYLLRVSDSRACWLTIVYKQDWGHDLVGDQVITDVFRHVASSSSGSECIGGGGGEQTREKIQNKS